MKEVYMTQSIEIISWNVNGIRAVAEKGAFAWLEERQPHILCLQEIKALPEQIPDNLFANRYPNISINSAVKKGYSGTLIASDPQGRKLCRAERDPQGHFPD